MRFHKPVGMLLLWWPTAWALWLANQGKPPVFLVLLFLLGTICMRAAGCIVNDLADRNIDLHVARTKNRPLTTQSISIFGALVCLVVLLLFACLILWQLPQICLYYAICALFIIGLYPFCKRFIQCPQLILSIAFSMGIPMAFAAANNAATHIMLLLLSINIFWVIAYDTEYAMADRIDDLRIGVKSSAILFANYDRLMIGLLQTIAHLLWLPMGLKQGASVFWSCWGLALLNLLYQHQLLLKQNPADYVKAFSTNHWYGFLMWLGLLSCT